MNDGDANAGRPQSARLDRPWSTAMESQRSELAQICHWRAGLRRESLEPARIRRMLDEHRPALFTRELVGFSGAQRLAAGSVALEVCERLAVHRWRHGDRG